MASSMASEKVYLSKSFFLNTNVQISSSRVEIFSCSFYSNFQLLPSSVDVVSDSILLSQVTFQGIRASQSCVCNLTSSFTSATQLSAANCSSNGAIGIRMMFGQQSFTCSNISSITVEDAVINSYGASSYSASYINVEGCAAGSTAIVQIDRHAVNSVIYCSNIIHTKNYTVSTPYSKAGILRGITSSSNLTITHLCFYDNEPYLIVGSRDSILIVDDCFFDRFASTGTVYVISRQQFQNTVPITVAPVRIWTNNGQKPKYYTLSMMFWHMLLTCPINKGFF